MSTAQEPASPPDDVHDPDDFFKDTRMSFGDHIEELRGHLWRALYGFFIALVVSMFIGKMVLDLITAPVKKQLEEYYDRQMRKVLAEKRDQLPHLTRASPFRRVYFYKPQIEALLKKESTRSPRPVIKSKEEQEAEQSPNPFGWLLGGPEKQEESPLLLEDSGKPDVIPEDEMEGKLCELWVSTSNPLFSTADNAMAMREIFQLDSPTTLRAEEAFFVWFQVCFVTGIVLGSPWIFYEIWSFVAAGLYPHEKRLVHVYLPMSLGLFIAGVAICELFVIPKALSALLWFNEWLGIKPDIRLNEWLSFAIFMPLVFGLSFQTPLVMFFLNRLGIVRAETFAGQRRMAWFLMAIFAAVITPSTDAFSMLFLWVPMSLLFELGLLMMWLSPADEPEDEQDNGELVEV